MIQSKQIFQEKQEFLLRKLELNLDSKATIWNIIQAHNIIQKKNQFIIQVKSIPSDGEEEVVLKTKLLLLEVLDQVDTFQRLALSHQTKQISLDGLYQKQVDQRM